MSLPVWRVGRKLGRTLYEQLAEQPSDDDRFLGIMETPELAREVVEMQRRRVRGGMPPEVDSDWANLQETPPPPSATDPDAPPLTRSGLRSSITRPVSVVVPFDEPSDTWVVDLNRLHLPPGHYQHEVIELDGSPFPSVIVNLFTWDSPTQLTLGPFPEPHTGKVRISG